MALVAGCTSLKRLAYEGFNRDSWQKPEEVMRVLEIKSGQHVADLGAGGGYFTFRLSQAVGPTGKVYAVDVDQGMVEYLKQRALDERHPNVIVVRGDYDDPRLPKGGVDLVFICNTYHHIENRTTYFTQAKRYLRAGGRVAIIDFNGKGWFDKLFLRPVPKEVIRGEMEAAGYRLQSEYDFLPRQHFLVFSG
jgi:ubiquinone/menaquinone biosynthesis C-methylase UbiE